MKAFVHTIVQHKSGPVSCYHLNNWWRHVSLQIILLWAVVLWQAVQTDMFCLLVVLPFETLKAASTYFCHWLIGCFTNRPVPKFILSCVVFACHPTESSVLQSLAFTKQPGSIVYPVETLERNREVVFSCEAQGSPPPIYRWVCPPLHIVLLQWCCLLLYSWQCQHPSILDITGKCLHLVLNSVSSHVGNCECQ